MPKISGNVVLACSKERAFSEISSIDFAEKMDLTFGSPQKEILFHNERLLRTITKVPAVGNVDMERIYIPERFTIISLRRSPMLPFTYFVGLQMLSDHEAGALLEWVAEFGIDAENASKEEGILAGLEKHEVLQFEKVRSYFKAL